MRAEQNNIIEGNLLQSVTKTQRVLLSSDFLKGIAVYDNDDADSPRVLVEFGEKPSFVLANDSNLVVRHDGFLKKSIATSISKKHNIIIIFKVYSKHLVDIFWLSNLVLWLLIISFAAVLTYLKVKEKYKLEQYAERARQASHDLAQPLLALNSLALKISEKSDSVNTLKAVIERINHIVDDLVGHKSKNKNLKCKNNDSFSEKINTLIKEKKISVIKNVHINLINSVVNFKFPESVDEFKILRIISNLIDNSIEATTDDHNQITVELKNLDSFFRISVSDTGKGIPQGILKKLGHEQFTHGKENGSGIGLWDANNYIKSLNGDFQINSQAGAGTSIVVSVPILSDIPKTIFLAEDSEILILDDDDLCIDTWKYYFRDSNIKRPIHYFSKIEQAEKFICNFQGKQRLFIFSDYNLKSDLSGLDFIENNQLQGQAILVTGDYHNESVKRRSSNLKVAMYPKTHIHQISIQII